MQYKGLLWNSKYAVEKNQTQDAEWTVEDLTVTKCTFLEAHYSNHVDLYAADYSAY